MYYFASISAFSETRVRRDIYRGYPSGREVLSGIWTLGIKGDRSRSRWRVLLRLITGPGRSSPAGVAAPIMVHHAIDFTFGGNSFSSNRSST
jgi:hypothetical protein